MDDKFFNILTNSNKDIDNNKLMKYLSGKLSAEDKHELEKQMADSDFVSDAVEGLEEVKLKKELNTIVNQLNNDLQKQLNKRKRRKDKRALKDKPWIYLAIVLLLALFVISFIVIKKYLDSVEKKDTSFPATEKTISKLYLPAINYCY